MSSLILPRGSKGNHGTWKVNVPFYEVIPKPLGMCTMRISPSKKKGRREEELHHIPTHYSTTHQDLNFHLLYPRSDSLRKSERLGVNGGHISSLLPSITKETDWKVSANSVYLFRYTSVNHSVVHEWSSV